MYIYNYPLYYEIAFGFIDPKKQADFFEKLIKRYSKRKIKTFLDIACGTSLQLRELAKRKYNCIALDINKEMLNYLKNKTKEKKLKIKRIKADMTKFSLKEKADFAFIMMGSLSYIKSNKEFLSHLDSVANSLNKGALYFIENYRLNWDPKVLFKKSSWTMKKKGIKIKTTYRVDLKEPLTQILIETIRLNINDHGKKIILKEKAITKQIFPEELKILVEKNGKFEFLGFFEKFKLNKLKKANNLNFILLRKK